MNACSSCGARIGDRTRSGLCAACARGRGHGANKRVANCSVCGIGITALAKTGMCKPCVNRAHNADPEFRRKIREGQLRRLLDPEFRERKARVARRNAQKAYLDPARRERARIIALEHLRLAFTPDAIQRKHDAIRAARAAQIDKRLAWCPPEYRALHRRNVNSKRMKAADSRAMIEAMIADKDAMRHLDDALDWLRRLCPVAKLENGFRVGNAILRPAEVIARARLRGWEPDRWAA